MKARVCVVVALMCVALWGNVVTGQETEAKPTADDAPAAAGDPAAGDAGADNAVEKPQPDAEGTSTTEKTQTETVFSVSPSDGLVEKAKTEGKEMMVDEEEEGDDDDEEEEEEEYMENEDVVADAEASSTNKENGAALLSASLPSLVVAIILAKVFAH